MVWNGCKHVTCVQTKCHNALWRALQLRAVACAVIVVFVRVLNIAVPLVYKRVVDTLSDATAGTHAKPPQTYNFREVHLAVCGPHLNVTPL